MKLESIAQCSLVSVVLAGCGAGPVPEEVDVGGVEQEIVSGTALSDAAAESGGWVKLEGSGYCSGTLIRNDLVLTARHCLEASMTATMGTQKFGRGQTFAHPNADGAYDVALVQLSHFMQWGSSGSRYNFSRPIYTGTNQSLSGMTLACYGYGRNVATDNKTGGTLRSGNVTVQSTNSLQLFMVAGPSGQLQAVGDSGSTCLYNNGWITGIDSYYDTSTKVSMVAPEAYRDWVNDFLQNQSPPASMQTASTSNTVNNFTRIDDPILNNKPLAGVHATANLNGPNNTALKNNAHTGVWYDPLTSKWTVFNESRNAMPVGAKFNYWKAPSGSSYIHVATNTSGGCMTLTPSCNVPSWLPQVSQLDFGDSKINGDANLKLFVTQEWDSGTQVYNNRAVGVWFDSNTAHWYVYNEDSATMPTGARFVVTRMTGADSLTTHTTSMSNVKGDSSQLSQFDIDGQPNAQIIITHVFETGSSYINKALGVRYDTSLQHWNIFTEDGSAMPIGLKFNIMIRP